MLEVIKMIKLSKREFSKIFEVKPKRSSLNSEFREVIETLMYKTNLSFLEVLDLIKNW